MTVLELFEKVNLELPTTQRRFFNYINDSIDELNMLYGDTPKLLFSSGVISHETINNLKDDLKVLPLYHNSIVDNILFLSGKNENLKGEFIRKSEEAYGNYWKTNAKGRKTKHRGW